MATHEQTHTAISQARNVGIIPPNVKVSQELVEEH